MPVVACTDAETDTDRNTDADTDTGRDTDIEMGTNTAAGTITGTKYKIHDTRCKILEIQIPDTRHKYRSCYCYGYC